MGTDTSHRGDSNQHTTPLPTSALLPSDTPITPTPEQVIKPGHAGQAVGPAPPCTLGRGPCQCGSTPPSPQAAPQGLTIWEMRLREVN